jgi:hypothetical protein
MIKICGVWPKSTLAHSTYRGKHRPTEKKPNASFRDSRLKRVYSIRVFLLLQAHYQQYWSKYAYAKSTLHKCSITSSLAWSLHYRLWKPGPPPEETKNLRLRPYLL